MQIQQWTVYSGGRQEHLTSDHVLMRTVRHALAAGVIISDAEAQTIAGWWHSPAQPYTTLLSTMGRVDRYTTLDMFGTEDECKDEDARMALRALGAYLTAKQAGCTAGYRPCACHDCFTDVVGRPGELCPDCTEHGCDPTDPRAECGVPGAYEDEDDGCTDPECAGCLYCIPGA